MSRVEARPTQGYPQGVPRNCGQAFVEAVLIGEGLPRELSIVRAEGHEPQVNCGISV